MKNPITLIFGNNERDNNLISYRKYGSEETYSMPLNEFIKKNILMIYLDVAYPY